ncbi:MAG: hypothetical protein K940chlam8_01112 [Chlamydiae bacterium]|nr:hypothetical protein [Chlamydiota bacterium]
MKALFNGQVIAESDQVVPLEGHFYFPASSVKMEFLQASEHHTSCIWKGEASYYHIIVGNQTFENGAWYYPAPSEKAEHIKDHIAFYTPPVEIQS